MRKVVAKGLFVLAGLAFLAASIGGLSGAWAFSFFGGAWWALAIAVFGVILMVAYGPNLGNLFLVAMGAYLFLDLRHIIPGGLLAKLAIPVMVVALIIHLIINSVKRKKDKKLTPAAKVQ